MSIPRQPDKMVKEDAQRPSQWASVFPASVPAMIVAIVTVFSMWVMRSCDDTNELLRENMDLRFNLVDEKFNRLNESIDQVRTELSDSIDQVRTELNGSIDQVGTELNGSMDQVRTELSEFKGSYEERVRYLERERMESANRTQAENPNTPTFDEEPPRVATKQ